MCEKVISWAKTSNTTWEVKAHRGQTATITLGAKPNPYTLVIAPGAVTTQHPTLAAAKNTFRKYLFTKPGW